MAKMCENEVIYMDTDSIKKIPSSIKLENSKKLGHMGLEYTKTTDTIEVGEFFYGCKNYGVKCKGTPNRKLNNSKYCTKGMLIVNPYDIFVRNIKRKDNPENGTMAFEFEKPFKMRSALRQDKNMCQWEKITKTVICQDRKRNWTGTTFYGQGTNSKPKHITYNGN
jgi:hypothetical protein